MFTTLKARIGNALTGGSFRHRLGRGLSAQAYCKGVTIFTQLVSIPVLLSAWGTELFGLWLLLSTVPAYLNLMDAGFTKVAGNDMIMRVAEDDWDGARCSLHSMTALAMLVFGGGCLIAYAVVGVLWAGDHFDFNAASGQDVALALLALITSVFLGRFIALSGAIAGSTRRVAQGLFWTGTVQLLETIAIITSAAFLGAGIAEAALAGLLARFGVTLVMVMAIAYQVPSLRIGLRRATLARIRSFLSPSFAALLLSMNNAMTMQGPLIVIGMFAGPAAVAVFSVCRTFARAGFQLVGSLNMVLAPEYSRLFKSSPQRYLRLFRYNLMIGCVCSLLLLVGVGLVGQQAIIFYTSSNIQPQYLLVFLITMAVCLEIIWRVFVNAVLSVNRHVKMSIQIAISGLVALALMIAFGAYWGLVGVAVALLIMDASILILSMYEFTRAIGREWLFGRPRAST